MVNVVVEQGIQVPLDSGFPKQTYELGFNPYKKPSLFSLNVNHVFIRPLKLLKLNLMDFNQRTEMDLFPDDDALMDFLRVYDNLPPFHHKKKRLYYLNIDGYYGEDMNNENTYDDNFPLEGPMKSNFHIQ